MSTSISVVVLVITVIDRGRGGACQKSDFNLCDNGDWPEKADIVMECLRSKVIIAKVTKYHLMRA